MTVRIERNSIRLFRFAALLACPHPSSAESPACPVSNEEPGCGLAENVDQVIEAAFADQRLVGAVVLVAHRGQWLYRRAAGLATASGRIMGEDSLFRLASVSKPIVSVAAPEPGGRGPAGPRRADRRLVAGVPSAPGRRPRGARITPRQLLSHSAGLGYRFLEADADGLCPRRDFRWHGPAGFRPGRESPSPGLRALALRTRPRLGLFAGHRRARRAGGAGRRAAAGGSAAAAGRDSSRHARQRLPLRRRVPTGGGLRQRPATPAPNGRAGDRGAVRGQRRHSLRAESGLRTVCLCVRRGGDDRQRRRRAAPFGNPSPGRRAVADAWPGGDGPRPGTRPGTAGQSRFRLRPGFLRAARPGYRAIAGGSRHLALGWRLRAFLVRRPGRELSVVALTNTLFEGMSGRFVNDLRDAVYRSAELR